MTAPDPYRILCDAQVRRAVEENRGRDPLEVALDKRIPAAQAVATQVKYLRRAASKLPSFAAAGCILPPLAYEQASSEACAARKRLSGGSVLDLTCGLGVDAFCLAQRFERVVTLERDAALAFVARENFARLGVRNVTVVHASAEAYLSACRERFDWVYADPDRRSAAGRKLVCLEDCSPDMTALGPLIARVGGRLCLKLSPMFDVEEAFRLFPSAHVEAVSLGGECKEVVLYDGASEPRLTAVAMGLGEFSAPWPAPPVPEPEPFRTEECAWLVAPDVALQKARLARLHLQGRARIESENGFGFAAEKPSGVLGRIFAVEAIEPFDAKALRRAWKGRLCGYLRRDFPLSAAEIARRTGIASDGPVRLAFTQAGGRMWCVRLGKPEGV